MLGLDPGPSMVGVAVYDTTERRVTSASTSSVAMVLAMLIGPSRLDVDGVAIERVQSYGISGGSLLRTSEVVGRLWQAAIDGLGIPPALIYRREVLRCLDVTGKGNRDSLVRARLIEMHGGTRLAACGRKATPGPLWGVASHAWSALAVAICAAEAS